MVGLNERQPPLPADGQRGKAPPARRGPALGRRDLGKRFDLDDELDGKDTSPGYMVHDPARCMSCGGRYVVRDRDVEEAEALARGRRRICDLPEAS